MFTHRRPECLYLCLESLRKCRRIENYSVYIARNEDSNPEIDGIVKELLVGLNYEIGIRPSGWLIDRANGEAIKAGVARSDLFTIAIGEDETVSRDFLEVIESLAYQNHDEKLFSIGTSGVLLNNEFEKINTQELMVKTSFFNGCCGVIFKASFEKYFKQYFCETYYGSDKIIDGIRCFDPTYVDKTFPEYVNFKQPVYTLDGLMFRICLKYHLFNLLLVAPRSHEIGFFGAHVNSGHSEMYYNLFKNKSLKERITTMKDLIESDKIKDFFGERAWQYKPLEKDHTWSHLYAVDADFDVSKWEMQIK